MSEVAFEGTEFERCVTVGFAQAFQFGGITQDGAGGVAVDVVDIGRIQARLGKRITHRGGLPDAAGARMPLWRPSLDNPTPRMTPRMRSPSRSASASRLRATRAAPADGTRPSASAWNGRERPDGPVALRT